MGSNIPRRQEMALSPLAYVLVVIFGSSSWLSVNSAWLELPIMVTSLPEGWGLPSFLAVIVQLACLGPLVYSFVEKCFHPNHPVAIVGFISFGCVATVFLAFFWNHTLWVAGAERSVALFILFFFVAIVNCTSNVLFLPYMAVFKPGYMTAYFIGMGMSGLVPSLLSLAQGAGKVHCERVINETSNTSTWNPISVEPSFSVGLFNGLMFIWMLIALVAFCLLNWLPQCREEMVGGREPEKREEEEIIRTEEENSGYNTEPKVNEVTPTMLPLWEYMLYLLNTFWACALMNGVLPSIQSFSCLPYGQTTYHFAVALSNIANPIACFIPFLFPVRNPRLGRSLLLLETAIATTLAAYILALAAMSPTPPLAATTEGSVICVLVWIVEWGLLAYLRTLMAGKLREAAGNSEKRLFWCGAFTQLGSFIGAIVIFPLINVTNTFTAAPSCPT